MKKPEGYDEARAAGEFTPIELGGHFAVIKQVTEMQSSTGKNMVVVLFDFSGEDAQPGYFADQFKNDDREDKKWPFAGRKYIMVQDFNDSRKTSRNFKTFCTCVERSNEMEINWNTANWGQQFVGKHIGVVYGEEEQEYEGKTSMRRLPKWFCSYDKVTTQGVPEAKYLSGNKPRSAGSATASDGFINVPEGTDEEIPF